MQHENVCDRRPSPGWSGRNKWPNTALDRTKRIKDAKSEAHKEIEEYRQQKEDEFKKFEAEVDTTLCIRMI